jgi:hypothetical protein
VVERQEIGFFARREAEHIRHRQLRGRGERCRPGRLDRNVKGMLGRPGVYP